MNMAEAPDLAFTLISEIDLPIDETDETALEMICNAMATGHGLVHRRHTFVRRYDLVNEEIVKAVSSEMPSKDPLRVYDVAVSNGVSAMEFFESLQEHFNPQFFAMDYLDALTVVGPIGGWRVVFDNVGRPLQAIGYGVVIPMATRVPKKNVINRLLKRWTRLFVLPRAKRVLKNSRGSEDLIVSINAFHPRARSLENSDPRFQLGFGDMYQPIAQKFDLIRAMSVFSNLNEDQIRKAVQALCSSLDDKGLLIVGRNPGRGNTQIPTTIFRREGHRLVPVKDLMGGAEQRETILSVTLSPV